MKVVPLTAFRGPQEIRKGGHLLPAGTWQPGPFEPELVQSDHPFLQQLLDRKLPIYKCLGELTVFIASSIVWLRIYEDHIRIEYIATYADKRQENSGKLSMRRLCGIADATNTTLKLTTDVVTRLEGLGQIPAHPVLIQGIKGKTRIPSSELVKWFGTFGFAKGERSTNKHVDYQGYHMERNPQPAKG